MSDISIYKGDTVDLRVVVKTNNVPKDLTGIVADAWLTAREDAGDADPPVFQRTLGDGITVTDAPNGVLAIKIAPADTSALATGLRLVFDVRLKLGTDIYTVAQGSFVILANVTHDVS